MSTEDSDTSSIVITISELIESAFGDPDTNAVHHKHIQAVLYILARQLRILERRVAVQLKPLQIQQSSSSISVTEVKIAALTDSKKRQKASITPKKGQATVKAQIGRKKSKSEKSTSTSDETAAAKQSSDKTSSYKTSSYAPSSDKYDTDKTSTVEQSSAAIKSSSADDERPDADKFIGKTTKRSGKKSTRDDASTTDKSSSAKTADKSASTSVGKTTVFEATDDASGVDEQEITLKRDKRSLSGKQSDPGKASSVGDDTTIHVLSTTDKISSVDKISGASTSDEKIPSTVKKSSTDKTTTSTEKTDTFSSRRKLSKVVSTNISTREKKGGNISADTISLDPQGYQKLLAEVEETREQELRVIRQRADSREQREKTPTPIASLDSFEATYEKLLVVERVPAEEARARAARGTNRESIPRLSVVTQEQFAELVSTVRNIQQKFAPVGSAELPENIQLMQELRKGASLTDAMAALQLSARLEATEKTLTNLLSLVTDLAQQTPGVGLTELTEELADDIEVLFGASGEKAKGKVAAKKSKSSKTSKGPSQKESDTIAIDLSPMNSMEILVPLVPRSAAGNDGDNITQIDDIITTEELQNAMQEVYDNIMKQVNDKSTQSTVRAETAMKMVLKLEKKIDSSLNLGKRMEELENLVSMYSEQINALDTGLSSQLTNYQEELTQMQHDLETGLETMAEVLANTGGDATAVAELNAHFTDLQVDIDDAAQRQKELRSIQNNLSLNLDTLRVNIEMLRETKSDRDEVVDALRDKAGLKDLNGLISRQQYDACRGDLEKRIATAYEKFNNQENVWQKAIDDLIRQLNEKADIVQVYGLRDSIAYYLEELKKKMNSIIEIVGEPVAVAVAKHLSNDTACLSCAFPAHLKPEENTVPVLPAMRPPTIGAEGPRPKEDGDGICYQGYPVKHPIDCRAHICNRWCGGSHTVTTNKAKSPAPPGITITPYIKKVGQERGTDGKMYAVEQQVPRKPCSQCLIPDPPEESKHDLKPCEEAPLNVHSFDSAPATNFIPDATPPLMEFDNIL